MANQYTKKILAKDRLFARTHKEGDCLIWDGIPSDNGYGYILNDDGRLIGVHRLAYILHYGFIDKHKKALHTCDIPLCINWEHLYEGTSRDNARDREIRRRSNTPKGSKHYNSILTPEAIEYIKEHYRPRIITQKMLAEKFGTTRSNVSAILRGYSWNPGSRKRLP